jgi:formylglycine-generating enzyme required for sulfatase activity
VGDLFSAPYASCPGGCRAPAGGERVIRGGDWGSPGIFGRAAGRGRAPELSAADQVGFRCAADIKTSLF